MTQSTAVSAQGTQLAIESTPGATITITAITKAVSAVVTGTHALAVGEEVEFGTSITGMPEMNGRLGVVTAISTTVSFTVNIDSSAFATAATGGTAAKKTWLRVGNVKDFNGFDGTVSELDKTHMESDAMEYAAGLPDFGSFGFNMDTDSADVGQAAMRTAYLARSTKAMRLLYLSGGKRLFKGFVKKFPESGGTNAILRSAGEIRITGIVNFYN